MYCSCDLQCHHKPFRFEIFSLLSFSLFRFFLSQLHITEINSYLIFVGIGLILAAAVFGEVWKLEPLSPQKKSIWRREMDWLLCVSDSIVELIPSLQEFPGGGTCEVMVTRPRSDLYVNLPALKKLDALLISILDGFQESEFYYVDRGIIVPDDTERFVLSSSSSGTPSIRREEKWWLPFPKVPPNGLTDDARKRLQQCRECTNQILKAAMAINGNVLAEMEIPNVYLQNLPKVCGYVQNILLCFVNFNGLFFMYFLMRPLFLGFKVKHNAQSYILIGVFKKIRLDMIIAFK